MKVMHMLYDDRVNVIFKKELRTPGNVLCADKYHGNTRFAKYVNNAELSDIRLHFPIENTFVPAHKFILGHAGPVFQRLIYGDKKNETNVITIQECEVDDFLVVLQYLYAGSICLSADRALRIIRVAHFYGLTQLEQMCYDVLRPDTLCNVLKTYELMFRLEKKELSQACVDTINRHMVQLCSPKNNVFSLPLVMLKTLNFHRAPPTDLLNAVMRAYADVVVGNGQEDSKAMRLAFCKAPIALIPFQNMECGKKSRALLDELVSNEFISVKQVQSYKVLQLDMFNRCRRRFVD